MSRRLIIVPANTFTDVSQWESVTLVQDEIPSSIYLDFDPSQGSTITKDGSDYVSEWRNTLGAQALNTAGSGSLFPKWISGGLNGYPIVDCNDAATRAIYSSADILHNLSTGYGWSAVVESTAVNSVFWASSGSSAGYTAMFQQTNRTWRNNGTEVVTVGSGLLAAGYHVLTGSYNPTGHVLNYWQDGTKLGGFTSAGLPGAARKLALGWNSVLAGRIKFARFMFFNATLTDQQASTVDRILRTQYAI